MWAGVRSVVLAGLALSAAASLATAQGEPPPAAPPPLPDPNEGVRWEFRDRPRLRFGPEAWADFRLKLQGEYRDVDPAVAEGLDDSVLPMRRVGVEGRVTRYLEYELSYELDDTDGGWRSAYANLQPRDVLQVQAGHFKVPFSRERLTGGTQLDFTERALGVRLLAPGYDAGGMVHGFLENHVVEYAVGVFRGNRDAIDDEDREAPIAGVEPAARYDAPLWAWRATARPLVRLDRVPRWAKRLEVGVNGTRSRVDEGRFGWRGETVYGAEFFDRVYVNGGRTRLGIDGVLDAGRWSLQGEWLRGRSQRIGQGIANEDLPALDARAWYLSGLVVLTGESRRRVDRPARPLFRGGFGGIEVGARVERVSLGSEGGGEGPPSSSPRGAHLGTIADRVWTMGLNYYPNRFVRVQVNAIREQLDVELIEGASRPDPSWSTVLQIQFVL